MQLTQQQISEVTQIMKINNDALFEHMKSKLENPTNMEELTKQFSWLEILEKSKETFNVLWDYVAKGLGILFVKGEILQKKWYNLFGILKIISLGRLFYDLIIEVYKIWAK